MSYLLKVPIKEGVVTAERLNKNACVDKQQKNCQNRRGDDTYGIYRRARIFKTLADIRNDREASDKRYREYKYVRCYCGKEIFVIKNVSVCSDKILEEIYKITRIFKFENTESDQNNKLVIYMHQYRGDLLKTLFADQGFDVNEYAEIKTPNYVVPARSVPKTGSEPNEKQR